MSQKIDDVDRSVLRALGRDARNTTAKEIAEDVRVSPSTIRNRIEHLETIGILDGYIPVIDYRAAGLPLQVALICTSGTGDGASAVEDLLDVGGVIEVCVSVADRADVHATVVAADPAELERTIDAIRDAGLRVDYTHVLSTCRQQPCNHQSLIDVEGDG